MYSFREDVKGSQEAPDSFTPAHVELIPQTANKMKIS